MSNEYMVVDPWTGTTQKVSQVHDLCGEPSEWDTVLESVTNVYETCGHIHTKPVVWPCLVRKEIVVGAGKVPLFKIIEQTALEEPEEARRSLTMRVVYYNSGIWIEPVGDAK